MELNRRKALILGAAWMLAAEHFAARRAAASAAESPRTSRYAFSFGAISLRFRP